MKEDKLEQYIRSNRVKFDDAEPPEEAWDRISEKLIMKPVKKIAWLRIALQAAAAILIFFSAWYLKDIVYPNHSANAIAKRENLQLPVVVKIIEKSSIDEQPQIIYTAAKNENYIAENSLVSMDTLPGELLEATQYYAEQISYTRKLIMSCGSYSNEIDQQVNVEFAALDSVYQSLRDDLDDNINNSDVLEAMILNYRMRLEILENIMQQLQTTADCSEQLKKY